MIITDNSDETFREDMEYLQMLVERIFRTAITQNLPLRDPEGHIEAIIHEIDTATAQELPAGDAFAVTDDGGK